MPSPPKRNRNIPLETAQVLANYMRLANISKIAPRATVRFVASAGSKNLRARASGAQSTHNIKERKASARRTAARWRQLTNQLHQNRLQGTNTLTREEKEFLNYYNFPRIRGEAYTKLLGNQLRRQPRSHFSTNPLTGYNLFRHMKTSRRTGTNPNGQPIYSVTPVFVYSTNKNKKGRTLYEKRGKERWKKATKKILALRK
jgi:hypothetical protein